MKKNNKGFTLVELIVVLVILAILAAILVPTLLGYIERARNEKDYSTAQTIRVAAQAQLDQIYGKGNTALSSFSGTFKSTDAGGSDVFDLAGVDKTKVTAFQFNYTQGIIKSGSVTINGRSYNLDTSGNWST